METRPSLTRIPGIDEPYVIFDSVSNALSIRGVIELVDPPLVLDGPEVLGESSRTNEHCWTEP